MSHAEIWDDSALVSSWNEALEEYKHYHSIHARGEKVEEVLGAFDGRENGPHETIAMDDSARQEETVISNGTKGDGNEEGIREDAEGYQPAEPQSENKLSQGDQALKSKPSEGGSQRSSPPLLQHLIGSVHDEGLKSLLMSWYYAGYYTGLYEGQHQGR